MFVECFKSWLISWRLINWQVAFVNTRFVFVKLTPRKVLFRLFSAFSRSLFLFIHICVVVIEPPCSKYVTWIFINSTPVLSIVILYAMKCPATKQKLWKVTTTHVQRPRYCLDTIYGDFFRWHFRSSKILTIWMEVRSLVQAHRMLARCFETFRLCFAGFVQTGEARVRGCGSEWDGRGEGAGRIPARCAVTNLHTQVSTSQPI